MDKILVGICLFILIPVLYGVGDQCNENTQCTADSEECGVENTCVCLGGFTLSDAVCVADSETTFSSSMETSGTKITENTTIMMITKTDETTSENTSTTVSNEETVTNFTQDPTSQITVNHESVTENISVTQSTVLSTDEEISTSAVQDISDLTSTDITDDISVGTIITATSDQSSISATSISMHDGTITENGISNMSTVSLETITENDIDQTRTLVSATENISTSMSSVSQKTTNEIEIDKTTTMVSTTDMGDLETVTPSALISKDTIDITASTSEQTSSISPGISETPPSMSVVNSQATISGSSTVISSLSGTSSKTDKTSLQTLWSTSSTNSRTSSGQTTSDTLSSTASDISTKGGGGYLSTSSQTMNDSSSGALSATFPNSTVTNLLPQTDSTTSSEELATPWTNEVNISFSKSSLYLTLTTYSQTSIESTVDVMSTQITTIQDTTTTRETEAETTVEETITTTAPIDSGVSRIPNISHLMSKMDCDGETKVASKVVPPWKVPISGKNFTEFISAFYVTNIGSVTGTSTTDVPPDAAKPPTSFDMSKVKLQDGQKLLLAPYWGSTLECKNPSKQGVYFGAFLPGEEGFTRIMALLRSQIQASLGPDSSGPTWILAVIWSRLTSTSEVSKIKEHELTFALFVVSDSRCTSIVYVYLGGDSSHVRENLLARGSKYPVVIGYLIMTSSGGSQYGMYPHSGAIVGTGVEGIQKVNGYYQNGTKAADLEDAYRGVFVYSLCKKSIVHPEVACDAWLKKESEYPPLPEDLAGKCPSNKDHFDKAKSLFTRIPGTYDCWQRKKTKAPHFITEAHTARCCYIGTDLLPAESHFKVNGSNLVRRFKTNSSCPTCAQTDGLDHLAYSNCCYRYEGRDLNSELCRDYLLKRPESTSQNYNASSLASSNGDPHFITADGFNYTMNGVGEYVLLSYTSGPESCTVQVRTEPAPSTDGKPPKATIFSAVAAHYIYTTKTSSDTVEFRLTDSPEDPTTRVVETLVSGSIVSKASLESTIEGNDVTISLENGTYEMAFSPGSADDAGLIVKTQESAGMLALIVLLPPTWKGATVGLMGNFDGNPSDDMKYKNGSDIEDPLDARAIFELAKTWYIDAESSVFTYPGDKTYSDYRNESFVPPFGIEDLFTSAKDQQDAIEVCGAEDDFNCLFDFAATGSALVAAATQSAQQTASTEKETLANEPPTVVASPNITSLRAVAGSNLTHILTAIDPNGDDVTWSLLTSPDDSVIHVTSGLFWWLVPELTLSFAPSLTVQVTDVKGSSSTSNIKIQYCPCKEGKGECQWLTDTSVDFVTVECQCHVGWTGAACDKDEDGCSSFPCETLCTDIPAAQAELVEDGRTEPKLGVDFMCAPCLEGMTGDGQSCGDINECELADKENGGCEQTCTNIFGGYICSCNASYTSIGHQCKDIDECLDTTICGPNSVCNNYDGWYSCRCMDGYEGKDCEDIDECEKETDGCDPTSTTCHNVQGTYSCLCRPGFAVDNFNSRECKNIDECKQENNCTQLCTDSEGSYSCSCSEGFEVVPDDPYSCQPSLVCTEDDKKQCIGGQCAKEPTKGKVICQCQAHQQLNADTCVDKDECRLGIHTCDDTVSRCQNEEPGYVCTCLQGYKALDKYTCVDIDECSEVIDNNPIHNCDSNQGICSNSAGSFSCSCAKGYQKVDSNVCEDVDECKNYPCDSNYGNCTNYPGGFTCSCLSGFEGDGFDCADKNECGSADNGGCQHTCTDIMGGYRCGCNAGYEVNPDNAKLCKDINECSSGSHTCHSEDYCANSDGDYSCTCPEGLELSANGKSCRAKVECDADHGCEYTCAYINSQQQCQCQLGYELILPEGKNCRDINECENNGAVLCPPENNVKCKNTNGSYLCECITDKYVKNGGGAECQDRDECQEDENACIDPRARCENEIGGYSCKCTVPLFRETVNELGMCVDVVECLRPCISDTDTECHRCDVERGSCTNKVPLYECGCKAGYRLKADMFGCEDIDECLEGTDSCNITHSQCQNVEGDYNCDCRPGYEHIPGTKLCKDTNECSSPDFDHGCKQICVNNPGSYGCQCEEGFRLAADGRDCNLLHVCSDAEMQELKCEHLCTLEGKTPTCVCSSSKYIKDGNKCTDIDECMTADACEGVENITYRCYNLDGGHNCTCIDGYRWGNSPYQCVDRDGGWSIWGGWSACSKSCGESSSQTRQRNCNNPPPDGDGAECIGGFIETVLCNVPMCPLEQADLATTVLVFISTEVSANTYTAQQKYVDGEMNTFLLNSVNNFCQTNFTTCCPYYDTSGSTSLSKSEMSVVFGPVFAVTNRSSLLAEQVVVRLSDPNCKDSVNGSSLTHLLLEALVEVMGSASFLSTVKSVLQSLMPGMEFNITVPQSDKSGSPIVLPTPPPPTPSTPSSLTTDAENTTLTYTTQSSGDDPARPAWLLPVAIVCSLLLIVILIGMAVLIVKKSSKVVDAAA